MTLWYALCDALGAEFLSMNFMKNALLAVIVMAPLFGLLSTMIVTGKMSFFSDALGHSGFTGIAIGVLCGAALAAACFLKILLVDRLLMGNESISLLVNGVVCLTLCVTVILAKFVGCTLPLFAKRLGFDPAVMASPFITTIVDALSLLVYFLFAKLLLGV